MGGGVVDVTRKLWHNNISTRTKDIYTKKLFSLENCFGCSASDTDDTVEFFSDERFSTHLYTIGGSGEVVSFSYTDNIYVSNLKKKNS